MWLNSLSNTKTCKGNELTHLFWGCGWPGAFPGKNRKRNSRGELKILGGRDVFLLLFFYYNFTYRDSRDKAWADRGCPDLQEFSSLPSFHAGEICQTPGCRRENRGERHFYMLAFCPLMLPVLMSAPSPAAWLGKPLRWVWVFC